ncbi:BRISC complex subunit FAM175B-like [Epargyreus clarus]|uniref:BRISC complex subunit FAM175B-like n=1 Tax=Epargyreus clarus TaxID=520877 RepID=UPI003C30DC48
MAYTEKVGLNSTALSILLYECINSMHSQEGFLIGNVTSEISNHISDSHNDTARLDTKIVVRNILPLPSVSMFYLSTGKIKEDVLADLLSSNASEVVGWYKYRKNSCLKPTFRDKLISRGLQKYFEKYHGKKQFVSCNLTDKVSPGGATHTLSYRFGKINCFDMYENLEDVTANLGEKLSGYKRLGTLPEDSVYQKVIIESNIQNNTTNDAILRIQDTINVKLKQEATIAAKHESTIRELESEIKQMSAILADKQAADLQIAINSLIEQKFVNQDTEMVDACIAAMNTPPTVNILNVPNILLNSNNVSDYESPDVIVHSNASDRTPSPILPSTSTGRQTTGNCTNIAIKSTEIPSTSAANCADDLITFDVDKPIAVNENAKSDSSPDC